MMTAMITTAAVTWPFHFGTTYVSPAACFSWALRMSGLSPASTIANDVNRKVKP